MARKRGNYTEPWIKVVTAISIIGLVMLCSTLVYLFILRGSRRQERYEYAYDNQVAEYKPLRQKWVRPIMPREIRNLQARTTLPLEIIRMHPRNIRPKNRQLFVNDRVSRLERNVALLKRNQKQEKALSSLEQRIQALQMLDTYY